MPSHNTAGQGYGAPASHGSRCAMPTVSLTPDAAGGPCPSGEDASALAIMVSAAVEALERQGFMREARALRSSQSRRETQRLARSLARIADRIGWRRPGWRDCFRDYRLQLPTSTRHEDASAINAVAAWLAEAARRGYAVRVAVNAPVAVTPRSAEPHRAASTPRAGETSVPQEPSIPAAEDRARGAAAVPGECSADHHDRTLPDAVGGQGEHGGAPEDDDAETLIPAYIASFLGSDAEEWSPQSAAS